MKDTIRTLLYEWQKRKLPSAIDRSIDLSEYIRMEPNKIIVVTGFRRVGKTYSMLLLLNRLLQKRSREEVVYVNFEDERIPLQTEFLTLLLPTMKELFKNEVKFLFLDEIQNIPNWSKWVRRVYDSENIRIFVSGSSSKMSSKEIPTELRGRFLEINISPLSFQEFLHFKNLSFDYEAVDYVADERAGLLKALDEYLKYGALPEIVLADEERKFEIAQSYYQTVIRRDIIERYNIKNEEALKAWLRLLLNSTSYSISKSYNTLKSLHYKVGKGTVQDYLSYIENSYFMANLPIFSHNIKDQMQYPRKVYIVDNVFINAISTKFSNNYGRLYENAVAANLIRKRATNPLLELYYWRNPRHEEVDFVVKSGTKVDQLIQACYDVSDPTTKKRELRILSKASKELKCDELLVVTRDYDAAEQFKKKQMRCLIRL